MLVSVLVSVFVFLLFSPISIVIIMVMFREDNILVEGIVPSDSSIIDIGEMDKLDYERLHIKGKTTHNNHLFNCYRKIKAYQTPYKTH